MERSLAKSKLLPTPTNEHHIHSIGLDFKIREHIEITMAPPSEQSIGWELFKEDGEMKLYSREQEIGNSLFWLLLNVKWYKQYCHL